MNPEKLMLNLNIKNYPEMLQKIYNSAMKEYEKRSNEILSREYLTELNNEYKLFIGTGKRFFTPHKKLRITPSLSSLYIY
jgi:hypothetical protein